MTIRRNVDLAAINRDYMAFENACENAPEGMFDQARDILFLIGTQADALLRSAQAMGLSTCNCDGIREIEVLMFAMLRRENPDSQIEQTIGLGHTLLDFPERAKSVLAGLRRDRDFITSLRAEDIDEDDGLERRAQTIIDPPEVAEQQADGTWAIMSGGGFVKGDFPTKEAAEQEITDRLLEAVLATR